MRRRDFSLKDEVDEDPDDDYDIERDESLFEGG